MLDPAKPAEVHIAERLASAPIGWLASVRSDGRPHSVPVWFCWADPFALVFSPPTATKIRNLRARPACTLTLESADLGNDIVILEGHGELHDLDGAEVRARREDFARKYAPLLQTTDFEDWLGIFSQPILVHVDRIVAWSKPGGELQFHVVTFC
jgi:PPOX class probable F420-dependent enzyme